MPKKNLNNQIHNALCKNMSSEFFAYYVFCCKKIPKTVVEIWTLWQHLCDVLASVKMNIGNFGTKSQLVVCKI
jgi:hypothetical protein